MKKILSLLLLVLLLGLTACKNVVNDIKVTVDNNYSDLQYIYFKEGDLLGELDNPSSREGYDFLGWFSDSEFNVEYNPDLIITTEITIYAKWEAHRYAIYFVGNGGSYTSPVNVSHDSKLVKPSEPTRDKYKFLGWFSDQELTKAYDFNKVVTNGFSIYAGWERTRLPLLELEEYETKYIVTSPGEDASTMININYQNKNNKSNVEYTKADDINYDNKKIVYPISFGFEELGKSLEKPFEYRNIHKVNITGLLPNTAYKYRINKGNNTYSEEYHFTTSGGSDTTSFLFLTDVHYYDGYDGAEIVEETIKSALKIQPGLDFIFTTGDMVDTGGNSEDWDKLFTFSESFKLLPYTGVPGNHEHYIIGDTKNDISHAYFNYPENSFDEYYGASYYFIHNDTLFIQIDTDASYRRGELFQWVDDTIANNKTKFVVVGTHAPFHFPSGASVNSDYKRPLLEIMEKHGVDLVLSGHYHSHNISRRYLDQVITDKQLGTTYLNGAGGGIKSIGDKDPLDFAKGYIVDVLAESIQIRYINARGNIIQTYNIPNYKLTPKETASNNELFDSIIGTPDLINQKVTFSWDKRFYKNIKEMKITEVFQGKQRVTLLVPTPGYTSYTFDNFTNDLDYKYIFEIEFNDGEVKTKEFIYRNYGGINLKASNITNNSITITHEEPSGDNINRISKYEVYLNGVLSKEYSLKNGDTFNTGTIIDSLESKKTYIIEVKVLGRNGFMFGEEIEITTK